MIWEDLNKKALQQLQRATQPWSQKFGKAQLAPKAPAPKAPPAGPRRSLVTADERLILEIVRNADHRGSDVRLDVGELFRLHQWPRQPIAADYWGWKVCLSYKWKNPQHINVLECNSVLDYIRHAGKRGALSNTKTVFLSDSQVTIAVLTKGRSSAALLNTALRRISALCRFLNIQPYFAWVRSADNPADGPSRWAL